MAPVRLFVDGFNRADIELAERACAGEMVVIDDIPPFEWQGPRSATRWFRDMTAFGDSFGMSEPSVELRTPRQVIVDGSRAYVVVPIHVQWLEGGRRPTREGWMTLALTQEAVDWRISALTWTWES